MGLSKRSVNFTFRKNYSSGNHSNSTVSEYQHYCGTSIWNDRSRKRHHPQLSIRAAFSGKNLGFTIYTCNVTYTSHTTNNEVFLFACNTKHCFVRDERQYMDVLAAGNHGLKDIQLEPRPGFDPATVSPYKQKTRDYC